MPSLAHHIKKGRGRTWKAFDAVAWPISRRIIESYWLDIGGSFRMSSWLRERRSASLFLEILPDKVILYKSRGELCLLVYVTHNSMRVFSLFWPNKVHFTDFFSTANQPKTSQNIRFCFIEIAHRVTYIQRLCFQTDNDLSSEFLQISNLIDIVSLLRNTSRQIFPRVFYKLVEVSCFYNKNSFHIVNNSTVIALSGHF